MQSRPIAILLTASVLATACGSRLTDEQRAVAIGSVPGVVATDATVSAAAPGTTSTGDGTSASGAGATGGSTSGSTSRGAVAGAVTSGTAPSSAGASTPAATGGATTTGGDAPDATGDTGDAGGGAPAAAAEGGGEAAAPGGDGAQAAPIDTRPAPAGGNGGATDVGVTADTIVLGNVSDISGAVPGLFEPSQLAVKAYLAYFAATEGTVYGRQLQYLPKDSRLDAGANRTASIELCENAFMGVGSVSALDQGGAPVIDECEIPDLRGSSNTSQMEAVDNALPASASTTGLEELGAYEWFAQSFPDAVAKASFVYICGEVTEQSTGALIRAQEAQLGYEYVYTQCIEIQETNYAPFVANMKDRGVEYVAFQGAYQQAVRLAESMRQQDYFPEVYILQSNIYNQNFLQLGGAAVEDSYIVTSSALVEEADSNPELQLYLQWLNQVAPGERPDGLGMYSWSAAKLAVQLLKDIGPEPTRAKMLDAMRGVTGWTGGGLHGPQDVAGQLPDNCFNVLQVRGGQFAKVHPGGADFIDCSSTAIADFR